MRPGERIGERFLIEARAGEGGMGIVFRARDLAAGQLVALKILKARSESQLQRFAREAAALAELRHAAIAQYRDHGRLADGRHYLVMEWIDGPTLGERIGRQAFQLEEAIQLAVRVADGLGAAHARGIIHRDVKPGNVLLPGGDAAAAKLVDFGLARTLHRGHASITETGALMGTLRYMAPEQARDAKRVDGRADVYALGAVLFECLAGRPAIREAEPANVLAKIVLEPPPRIRALLPTIPAAVDDLLAAMMAKDPAERPADGWAARALLERMSESSVPDAGSASGITARERRLMWVMLVAEVGPGEPRTQLFGAPPAGSDETSPATILEAHGGELQHLADGTALVAFKSGGATEAPWRAAMTALAWRARHPRSRIALAAGPGILAHERSDALLAPAQIGEVVDRASAALVCATPGIIRLEPAARALLERRFVVHGDDRGGALLAPRSGDEVLPQVLGRAHDCVGRSRELGALIATLEECVDERVARAVLVKGEAGIGKSRLLRELALHARETAGLCILRGRVDALQDGAPFALLADLVRSSAGIARDDDLPSARGKLERRVAAHVPIADQRRVCAFLGEMASIPFPDAGRLSAARNDAVLMGDSIQGAVEDFFAAEACASPLLLMLDDMHWADAPSVRLVRAVLRHSSAHPLMIVASGRPEMDKRFGDLLSTLEADVVALGPLTRKASERLVESILGDRLDSGNVSALVQKSGGNPLFIEELARAAVLGRNAVVDTILGAVQARLDDLDGHARRVLRAASVFGLRFWAGGVRALAAGGDDQPVERRLAELERGELIRQSRASSLGREQEYVFVHDLVRDGVYAMLTDEDRERGHALAGEWLEQAGARDAEVLALHFERGGLRARALPWWTMAAQQALDGNDFRGAVTRADDALGAGGATVPLCLVKAEALRHLGRYGEAMSCARRALAKAPRGASAWFRAATELARASAHANASDELADVCRELRDSPTAAETVADQVRALCITAWGLQQLGRLEIAYELVDSAQQLVDAHGIDDPLSRAYLCAVRAVHAYNGGDLALYLRESARAQDLYAAGGDRRQSCGQALNVVVGYVSVGCYDRASEVATRLLGTVRRLGLRTKECFALNLISNARLELGDLDGAERAATEAHPIAVECQHPRQLGFSEALLGRVATARGHHDEALQRLEAALRHFDASPSHRVHTLAAMAQACVRRGDAEAGLAAAEQACDLATRIGVGGTSDGHIAVARAEALIALGRGEEAAIIVREAARAVRERAGAFDDEWLRERFLEGIAAHRRLAELDRELSSQFESRT